MLIGQTGSGKSSFQNLLEKEKIARERDRDSITYRFSFYSEPSYNITTIDTYEFENDSNF